MRLAQLPQMGDLVVFTYPFIGVNRPAPWSVWERWIYDTVDGQNPAPPITMIIPLFLGF